MMKWLQLWVEMNLISSARQKRMIEMKVNRLISSNRMRKMTMTKQRRMRQYVLQAKYILMQKEKLSPQHSITFITSGEKHWKIYVFYIGVL